MWTMLKQAFQHLNRSFLSRNQFSLRSIQWYLRTVAPDDYRLTIALLFCFCPMMMDIDIQHVVFAGSTILLATLVMIYVKPQARSRYKSPPGPRGLPILGNVLQVPEQVKFHRIIDYPKGYGLNYLLEFGRILLGIDSYLRRARIIKPGRHCA